MRVYLSIKWTVESWKDCYFWTFTFPDAKTWPEISVAWKGIHHALRDAPMRWPWAGIRVYELHPGGHGVHIHCLTPYLYPIREVLDLTKNVGLCGRLHTKRINGPRESIARYMAEYLCKWRWVNKAPKGTRLWATFNLMPGQRFQMRDIETEGPRKRVFGWVDTHLLGWGPLMWEFGIDHRPKLYHRCLCMQQLFAMHNPVGFLAQLYSDAPEGWLNWGEGPEWIPREMMPEVDELMSEEDREDRAERLAEEKRDAKAARPRILSLRI